MQTTANYGLKKPDGTDVVNIQDFNDNVDVIDTTLAGKVDKVTGRQLSTEDYSTAEKAKLAGVATGANNYVHPSGDGNQHVPATGTTHNGQVLKSGATAGSAAWGTLVKGDVGLGNVDNTADSTKNVASAAKLTTSRTISLTGGASGSAGFDGSANASITVTVADDSHNHVISNVDGLQSALNAKAAQADFTAHLADYAYQTAGGTATAITLTTLTLTNGYPKTFIASANNNGSATTINGKPLYKPGTTSSPNLIAGKAYTVWYSLSDNCFFIKASAEGTAVAENVLAGETFSNDNDTGLIGTMINRGAGGTVNPGTSAQTKYAGYYSSNITIAGDPDLIPANILDGKNIFGVTGTAQGKENIWSYLNSTILAKNVVSIINGEGIWVDSSSYGVAELYNSAGTLLSTVTIGLGTLSYLDLIAVSKDRMIWFQTRDYDMYITDKSGTVLSTITAPFSSSFRDAHAVMNMASDRIYVEGTNGSSSSVKVLNSAGTQIGSTIGMGASIVWVAVTPHGALYKGYSSLQAVYGITSAGATMSGVSVPFNIFIYAFSQ